MASCSREDIREFVLVPKMMYAYFGQGVGYVWAESAEAAASYARSLGARFVQAEHYIRTERRLPECDLNDSIRGLDESLHQQVHPA